MTEPVNKLMCKLCGDVIESKNRHDFVRCKCKSIFVDGGKDYFRRGGDIKNMIDLSVYADHTNPIKDSGFQVLVEF